MSIFNIAECRKGSAANPRRRALCDNDPFETLDRIESLNVTGRQFPAAEAAAGNSSRRPEGATPLLVSRLKVDRRLRQTPWRSTCRYLDGVNPIIFIAAASGWRAVQ